jgi:hypothetical protein
MKRFLPSGLRGKAAFSHRQALRACHLPPGGRPGLALRAMFTTLEKFGSFRTSVTSEGTDTPQEQTVSKVKSVRLVFTPASQLKESLSRIRLEIVS